MTALTSAEIREKLKDLAGRAADLEAKFEVHAADAVEGDKEASKKAADANAKIERLAVERRALEAALNRAKRSEAEAAEAEKTQRRAEYMTAARDHAHKVVDAAEHVDRLIADLKGALADVATAEGGVWNALCLARETPPGAMIGRTGLAGEAIAQLAAIINGTDQFRHSRPTADMARIGWAFLLDDETEKEAV